MTHSPAAQLFSAAAATLRRRANIVLPALLLLVLLAGLGGFLLFARLQAVRSAETAAENLVQVIESRVEGDLSRLESLLLHVASEFNPEHISRLSAAERLVISRRLAFLLHDFPAAGGLNIFDTQGWLLLSDQTGRVPFSIADRPHFQALRSNPGLSTVFSDALRARSSGAWSLVLSRAVRSPDGRLLGVITAPLNLDEHGRLFGGLHVGPHSVTLMRRSDNFKLVQRSPRMSEADFNQPLPEDNPIRQRVTAGETRFTLRYTASVDGVARVGSVRVLEKFPFYVQVALAEQDVFAEWRQQAVWVSALTLLLLAAFGLAVLRLRRSELAAAAAQAASEERLRALFDIFPDGILLTDPQTSLPAAFNPLAHQQLGYTAEEFARLRIRDYEAQETPEDVQAHIAQILKEGRADFETTHRRKDGSLLPVRVTVMRISLHGTTHFLSVIRDISERRQIEAALRESLSQLKEAQRIAKLGSWEFDLSQNRLSWSDEIFRIFGLNPEQRSTSHDAFLEAVHPEDQEAVNAVCSRFFETHAACEITHRLLLPDGGIKYVREQCETRSDAQGMPLLFVGTAQDVTELAQAEQNLKTALAQLERERSFLKTLIQTVPDLIWLKDPEGVYLACNPAFERFFGTEEAKIVGRTDYDFVSREQADMFRTNDRQAVSLGGPVVNEEWITYAGGGGRVLLEITKMPMRGPQGRLIGVLGIGHDITRTRRLEENLRAAHDLKQHYLNTVEAIIVSLDRSGRITMINRKGCELLGWPEEELLGIFWFERCLVQPHGLTEAYPAFLELIAGRRTLTGRFENHILTRSGEARLIAWRVSCLRSAEGEIVGTLSAGEDITERKAAEQELRRVSKLMRMILDSASEGICGLDRQGRTIFINRAGAELLGWQPEELLGRSQHQLAHHRKADGTPYAEEECPASLCCIDGRPREVTDEVFWRKDGSSFPAEYVASPIIDSDGGITGAMLVFRSLSERVALLNGLARSNAELEQFAYAASHDLRQPLRMIANFLQLLQMELGDALSDGQKEYIQFAVSGAKRLDAMLLGLLEYSRVGRMGEPPVWLESRAVLDEALLFLRPAAAEAGAAVRVEGDWPSLKASPDSLLRLLQNLIGNALKFRVTGRAPEVTVSGRLLSDRWRLTVTDNGIGLPPSQRDRLFQVFNRLRTHGEYEGTGIGLAVARKIAEQHGGSICAESLGEGQGSSFIVELPLAEAEP